ncbi:MAG: hypothetical protein JSS09_05910 [Verrucomicrobia bacterium]|nr:hypothetical protein [Verrucomicrobiota bacterium]
MSFDNQLNTLLNNFFSAVADKYSVSREEIKNLWLNGAPSAQSAQSTLIKVDTNDISNERLLKSNKTELVALCKSRGLKYSGTKDELMQRLRGGNEEPKEAKEVAKAKVPTKKADRAMAAVSVIQKLTSEAPTVPLRKNKFNNHEHPPTRFVFDTKTEEVIGKQNDSGTVEDLTDEDIQTCKKNKFKYRVPDNLEKNNVNNVTIRELDEIPEDGRTESDVVETVDDEEDEEELEEDEEIEL